MSLLNRKPLSIGRAQRVLRDDRVFVVATDDTYAPDQYFRHLPLPRVKVTVLPTPEDSGLSGPMHVVERLKAAFEGVRERKEIQEGDEFWVFLDTDHHFTESHLKGTLAALKTARHVGFEIAISNPCFELWLLLHHMEVPPGCGFSDCDTVAGQLRQILGQYSKTLLKPGQFPLERVPDAIRRARSFEASPDETRSSWPMNPGTRVYRLLERVLPPNV
jgi:hypothetical protein